MFGDGICNIYVSTMHFLAGWGLPRRFLITACMDTPERFALSSFISAVRSELNDPRFQILHFWSTFERLYSNLRAKQFDSFLSKDMDLWRWITLLRLSLRFFQTLFRLIDSTSQLCQTVITNFKFDDDSSNVYLCCFLAGGVFFHFCFECNLSVCCMDPPELLHFQILPNFATLKLSFRFL